MDQMTSALGGAGQLLALLCQPAEVQAHVQIPDQVGERGGWVGFEGGVGGGGGGWGLVDVV